MTDHVSAPAVASTSSPDLRHSPPSSPDRDYFGKQAWGVSQQHLLAEVDVDRLERFGLPVLRTEQELADWLGISCGRLRWFTHDQPQETSWHSVRFAIPKRSGGQRVILAPKRELKRVQRRLLADLVGKVPAAAQAHGFVRGRSIVTNASAHVGKQVLLQLDLHDFFPSITFPRVRGLFLGLGYPFAVATTLALLCTEYDREPCEQDGRRAFVSRGPRHLVQGAPTSPGLANLVAWRLDHRLAGLAASQGFLYTRYADDLTFSGDHVQTAWRIRAAARHIIREERFDLNCAKTRLTEHSARQLVTGLVVNEKPAVPRALRKRLRAILHQARTSGLEAQNRGGQPHFPAYLQGLIAFVHAANPTQALPLRTAFEELLLDHGLHQQGE